MNEIEYANYDKEFNYYLYNILTNEMFQIHVNLQKLTQMMEYIIYQKYYSNSEKVPDEVFIQNMRKLITK